MKWSLAYEMQRPIADDHAVIEETIPHDKVMSSIELFGKYVMPELQKKR